MKNTGRPLKIEPNQKRCVKCLEIFNIDGFELSPSTKNPFRRRNDCKLCRKKYNKERTSKLGFYAKQYRSMSPEKKAEYIRKKSTININRTDTTEKRKTYNSSEKGIYNRYRNECKRRGNKKRNICVFLTFEEFSSIINKPCAYCGEKKSWGIDRIDPTLSYTIDNSAPCCEPCNRMKWKFSLEEFKARVTVLYNRFNPKEQL